LERDIPLPDDTVDFVLLYDIFWYFRPSEKKTEYLMKEVRRVARGTGVVSVYPTHIDQNSLRHFKSMMEETGFVLVNERSRRLVHEKTLVEGILQNYKKVENPR
jgi:2-hydroxychromene-2-carboxylate isomerase